MGHRSGWQNIVVWTDACESQSHVIAVSYSSHGHYGRDKKSPNGRNTSEGRLSTEPIPTQPPFTVGYSGRSLQSAGTP
ncbi:NPP1 family protein [Sinorhizobium medicae]|uniref:NPP1 family protein n=1 Tax=Sinorhizobium medicae TaxID=110321 RepID=UPI001F48EC14|nr:NPP1 family protein [Sinorhizobium medicae]